MLFRSVREQGMAGDSVGRMQGVLSSYGVACSLRAELVAVPEPPPSHSRSSAAHSPFHSRTPARSSLLPTSFPSHPLSPSNLPPGSFLTSPPPPLSTLTPRPSTPPPPPHPLPSPSPFPRLKMPALPTFPIHIPSLHIWALRPSPRSTRASKRPSQTSTGRFFPSSGLPAKLLRRGSPCSRPAASRVVERRGRD